MSLQLLESMGKSSLGTVRKNPTERLSFSWLPLPQLSSGPATSCHLWCKASVVAGSLTNINMETEKPSLNHSIISDSTNSAAELVIWCKGIFLIYVKKITIFKNPEIHHVISKAASM